MRDRRLPVRLILLVCILSAGHSLWLLPDLPPRVASHFGADGTPDGLMSRNAFLVFYAVFSGVVIGSAVGLGKFEGEGR